MRMLQVAIPDQEQTFGNGERTKDEKEQREGQMRPYDNNDASDDGQHSAHQRHLPVTPVGIPGGRGSKCLLHVASPH
jgi:hypothetical protein